MRHGSLFSGIGGFDLAAEWMGWENVFHCECEPYPAKVIKQISPNSKRYENIIGTDFTIYRGLIDLLSGGWPCQDNSKAKQIGQGQLGLQGNRSGLFYEYERAIREIRPKYALSENVPDVLTVNRGRDFNYILSAFCEMGYNVTWGVLRASDIGAPHHRERLYILAYPGGFRSQTLHSIWRDAREAVEIEKFCGLFDGAAIPVGGSWKMPPPNFTNG